MSPLQGISRSPGSCGSVSKESVSFSFLEEKMAGWVGMEVEVGSGRRNQGLGQGNWGCLWALPFLY